MKFPTERNHRFKTKGMTSIIVQISPILREFPSVPQQPQFPHGLASKVSWLLFGVAKSKNGDPKFPR
jgi:hypothetical protein